MANEPPVGPGQPPPPSPTGPSASPAPQPGSRVAGSAWYNGPLPIAELVPKETIGSAIGRTAVKALTALVILGGGLLLIPFLLIALIAGIGGAAGLGAPPAPRTFVAGESDADINLVAVPVSGLILGEDRGAGGGLFAPIDITYGYTIQEKLDELADDDAVDGIVLEIDSPGGTIFGSKAIADGVAAYKSETGKPVVAFVSGLSASGGVYAMAGADEIYADTGTLIGSIGVIFGPFTRYNDVTAIDGGLLSGGVTTENGIEVEYLTAGRSKDLGNPYRSLTDEERAVLQEGLDDAYADFVSHVSEGRDIPEAEIEKELGALIFGEQQALANGLIDGISSRDESYRRAAVAAGLDGDQTWRVERIETAGPGLLGLFAARLAGDGEDTDVRRASATEPICLGSGTILAYHGDPALLCASGP